MKIKLILVLCIIIILIAVIVLSLIYLKSESEKLIGYIENEKYEELYDEYDKTRIILSFLLDGKKVAEIDEQIENIKTSGPDEETIFNLKADIKDWLVSEYPSFENIF